jgi:hypothetical protein
MNTNEHQTKSRILAIAPSARGFGFAVMEGPWLVDWGVKSITKENNLKALSKANELLALYHPSVTVLQDTAAKNSRRSTRIRDLTEQMVELARKNGIRVKLLSRKQIQRAFFEKGDGTKHRIAEIIAQRFPEELGCRLPPKRRPWMSEDYRMDIFAAVALALTLGQSGLGLRR